MKVVIAPDSFKGSLTALEAAQVMAAGVRHAHPQAEIVLKPMADGGEGTLDVLLAASGGERRAHIVTGANGAPVEAAYGILLRDGRRIGVIEAAQVVGFGLVDRERDPVAMRTTRGVGELLMHLLDEGLRDIVLAVGGTSTNDGGAGFLEALGVRLLDACGHEVAPTITGLWRLTRLGFAGLDARLHETTITLLSDVSNPLCGPNGATAVYGPQKGVNPRDVPLYDMALSRLALLGDAWCNRKVSLEPGAGAAGGLGYAALLLGAKRMSGAETVAKWIGLREALAGADWVMTGEGRTDVQTLQGKAPFVVALVAADARVPVALLSGTIDAAASEMLALHFARCCMLASDSADRQAAMARAAELLREIAAEVLPRKPE